MTTKPQRSRAARSFDIDSVSPEELLKLVDRLGGQRSFSRKYGVPRATLQLRLNKIVRDPFGHRPAPPVRVEEVFTGVRRFIVSSAQDSTKLHDEFFDNLLHYRDILAEHAPCDLIIAGFTYNKRLFEEHSKKAGKNIPLYPDRVKPYLAHERVRLGNLVDFCGEMNTLPTAETPLSGFETYTRHRWGIFPHAKVQLRSIPTMKSDPAKVIMTTGAVTRPNYVPKRAGIKATFNHSVGAVLVEVASDGSHFCRHLLADDDGTFYDLDRKVETHMVPLTDEEIAQQIAEHGKNVAELLPKMKNAPIYSDGHRIAAINWGDLHCAQIDPEVARASFGYYPTDTKFGGRRVWRHDREIASILDVLRPQYQFFHDTFDNQRRNHHNLRDPHHMYALYCDGLDTVEDEVHESGQFIDETRRPWCETIVVESNHDLALKRWLREGDYRTDPPNAEFFLTCQKAIYGAIRRGDHTFSIFEWLLKNHYDDVSCEGVEFLRQDQSCKVLGIEKGMHGHLGANGARGSPHTFVKAGPKSTTGHTHSCEIRDGSYVSGTTSSLDMGYNLGLSSWSHSHVVTYPNGKRVILTMQKGKWRL